MTDLATIIAFTRGALEEASAYAGAYEEAPATNFARRRKAADHLAAVLTRAHGARISQKHDASRIRMAGLASSCTAGLEGAVQNWIRAAEKRLAEQTDAAS